MGALWTPGYWGADGPRYRFHHGYWGRHVGFYGGVPYGGGYGGTGYRGGYWNGNRFYYNRAVNRVDPNVIHDVYERPEPAYLGVRVSYNGGSGGIAIMPIAAELIALREQHERPIQYQVDLERQASSRRGQFYGVNQGRPEVYIAPEGFERGVETRVIQPQIVVQRPVVVEQRAGRRATHTDTTRTMGMKETATATETMGMATAKVMIKAMVTIDSGVMRYTEGRLTMSRSFGDLCAKRLRNFAA